MRTFASIAAVLVGVLMILGGMFTWYVVSTTLAEQNIVTPDDACLSGRIVADPFTAYCQAEIIQEHTLESTDGATYAELDPDDPLRDVAMNSAFLQSSLFTSIVAFGVAAMAMAIGLLFILIGIGIRDVSHRHEVATDDSVVVRDRDDDRLRDRDDRMVRDRDDDRVAAYRDDDRVVRDRDDDRLRDRDDDRVGRDRDDDRVVRDRDGRVVRDEDR